MDTFNNQLEKWREELKELLEKNKKLIKSEYPNLNYAKYAFITFKSIEARDQVLSIFRTRHCNLKYSLCDSTNYDESRQFLGSAMNVTTVCDPEFLNHHNMKFSKMQKIKSRCISYFLGLLNLLAAIACLSAYQIWIGNYQEGLDQYNDRDEHQKKELFWGNINVLA